VRGQNDVIDPQPTFGWHRPDPTGGRVVSALSLQVLRLVWQFGIVALGGLSGGKAMKALSAGLADGGMDIRAPDQQT
jgi:hypothetical protein